MQAAVIAVSFALSRPPCGAAEQHLEVGGHKRYEDIGLEPPSKDEKKRKKNSTPFIWKRNTLRDVTKCLQSLWNSTAFGEPGRD